MTFKTKKDHDDNCFIQTVAFGFSSGQRGQPRMTSGHGALLLIVMLGLLAGAYMLQRRVG